MKRRAYLTLAIVSTLVLSPFFLMSSSADSEISINVHMIGEKTRTRFGKSVVVAGIWHYINVTLETNDFEELTLRFFRDESMPSMNERNASNYYEWRYSKNSVNPWRDMMEYEGRRYINNMSCLKDNDNYCFCVGVKDTLPSKLFYHQNWTLEVYIDGNNVYSEGVVLEKPTPGLAKSHADFINFNIDPFTVMDAFGDDFFRVENTGNIPLYVTVDFGVYDNVVESTGFDRILSPFCGFTSYVTVHSKRWKPGRMVLFGNLNGKVPGSIIVPFSNFTFETSVELNAPELRISIGHEDYEIFEFVDSDVIFQYVKEIEMKEGEIRDIIVYISGEGTLALDLRSKNLTILKVFSGEIEVVDFPLVITSKGDSEHLVKIKVKALGENSVAFLYYDLRVGGETQVFSTKIRVGPPEPKLEETSLNPLSIVAVLGIIGLVMGYMMCNHIRYRWR